MTALFCMCTNGIVNKIVPDSFVPRNFGQENILWSLIVKRVLAIGFWGIQLIDLTVFRIGGLRGSYRGNLFFGIILLHVVVISCSWLTGQGIGISVTGFIGIGTHFQSMRMHNCSARFQVSLLHLGRSDHVSCKISGSEQLRR